MIAVETVLRKLISEYEFVVIPGFGALLSHHIPASFDKNAAFFSPPAKKLAFNEYLKLDDGLLANYISRHEMCSHNEAVEYVRAYTDQLRLNLESEGHAVINGIGEFGRNVEGKLVFEPRTERYFKDEWYGFEKVRVKHFNKQVAVKTLGQPITVEEEVEVIEFEDRVRTVNWGRWAAAAVITGLLCGLSLFFVNSKNSDIQSTLNPFKELFSQSGKADKHEINEVKKEVEPAAAYETIVVEEEAAVADSFVADKAVVDSSKIVFPEPAPAIPAPVKASAKFYVIAGAFKGSKQAKVLLADLQQKGFEEALIIPGNKYSTKVKVAINGYNTESEAYRASRKLKSIIGQEGWVFKSKSNN
jgi:cell division septation protein DedD/nucleoid DNA-binding protein